MEKQHENDHQHGHQPQPEQRKSSNGLIWMFLLAAVLIVGFFIFKGKNNSTAAINVAQSVQIAKLQKDSADNAAKMANLLQNQVTLQKDTASLKNLLDSCNKSKKLPRKLKKIDPNG